MMDDSTASNGPGPNTEERMADRPPVEGTEPDAATITLDDTPRQPGAGPAVDDV